MTTTPVSPTSLPRPNALSPRQPTTPALAAIPIAALSSTASDTDSFYGGAFPLTPLTPPPLSPLRPALLRRRPRAVSDLQLPPLLLSAEQEVPQLPLHALAAPRQGRMLLRERSLWTALGGRKRWVPRHVVLQPWSGLLTVWADAAAAEAGGVPLQCVTLRGRYGLADAKAHAPGVARVMGADRGGGGSGRVAEGGGTTRDGASDSAGVAVHYRALLDPSDVRLPPESLSARALGLFSATSHLAAALGLSGRGTQQTVDSARGPRTAREGVVVEVPASGGGGGGSARIAAPTGSLKVLHFGCEDPRELDAWSAALHGALLAAAERERAAGANADAVAASARCSALSMLQDTVRDAATAAEGAASQRASRDSLVPTSAVVSPPAVTLVVRLIDGTPCAPLELPWGACARDAVALLSQRLGLRAHADWSLCLSLPAARLLDPVPHRSCRSASAEVAAAAAAYVEEPQLVFCPDVLPVSDIVRRSAEHEPNAHVTLRRRLRVVGGGAGIPSNCAAASSSAGGSSNPAALLGECGAAPPACTPPLPSAVQQARGMGEGSAAWLLAAEAARPLQCAPLDVAWGALAPHADADAEAAAATGPCSAALRLVYLEAAHEVTSGALGISLGDAVFFGGLQALVEHGPVHAEGTATVPRAHGAGWYRVRLLRLLSSQALAQAYRDAVQGSGSTSARTRHTHGGGGFAAESAALDGLAGRVRAAHLLASEAHGTATAGEGAYVALARLQLGHGASFFRALLTRHEVWPRETCHGRGGDSGGDSSGGGGDGDIGDGGRGNGTVGSGSPERGNLEHRGLAPLPLPMLVSVSASGVSLRPAPPTCHADALLMADPRTPNVAHARFVAQCLDALDTKGGVLHLPTCAVEEWGVKRLRPAFMVRTRDDSHEAVVELTSPAHRELAAAMQGAVYRVMRLRALPAAPASTFPTPSLHVTGIGPRWHALPQRELIVGSAALARDILEATCAAKSAAVDIAEAGWTDIVCPGTGGVVLWHADGHVRFS